MLKIGVLALQGAFEEHIKMLGTLSADGIEIRSKNDLNRSFDGIIIPGGESTVISKLLNELNMRDTLLSVIKQGLPVFGTCAGMILMSSKVLPDGDDKDISPLNLINCTAQRNAYGRQLGSFSTTAEFKGIGEIPMVFIRAPYISNVSDSVEVLSEVNGKIVAVRQGKCLATAFHPELTDDLRVHEYFLKMI